MTAQYKREQVYPRTDHKDAMLDEHEAINNRLRARIVELAAMVDMMKDVNAAQAAEIVTLTAEVERWREAHNRRTQLVVDATLRKLEREEYNV